MGFTKQRANHKSKVTVEDFIQLKIQLILTRHQKCIQFEEIPYVSWEQTGLKIVPGSNWTMEQKGTKRVEMIAIDDKCQLTGVFG